MKKTFGVVIAAGGTGTRFGTGIPKQFTEILGVPVIAHTIWKFQKSKKIDRIVIVTRKEFVVLCSDIIKEFDFPKVSCIIEGGSTRQASVFNGLKAIDTDYVLIHDAVRPLVSQKVIESCCDVVSRIGSCAAGARAIDTIKISQDGEYITSTPDRNTLWHIQTPQCFERDFILKCHENAIFESFEATDDCMLAERYGARIKLVESSMSNIKITNYDDLAMAEALLDD